MGEGENELAAKKGKNDSLNENEIKNINDVNASFSNKNNIIKPKIFTDKIMNIDMGQEEKPLEQQKPLFTVNTPKNHFITIKNPLKEGIKLNEIDIKMN